MFSQGMSCPICHPNYTYEEGTVTKLLQDLNWKTLKERREQARLIMLYRIHNNLIAIHVPKYVTTNTRQTRYGDSRPYRQLPVNNDIYKYTFLPRTVCKCNRLPVNVVKSQTLERELQWHSLKNSDGIFSHFVLILMNVGIVSRAD